MVKAKRNCDFSGATALQPYFYENQCRTEYKFGTRTDKCICNEDYCNASRYVRPLHALNVLTVVVALLVCKIFF